MSETIYDLVKTMTNKMGELLGVKVYITVTDNEGNFIASDTVFEDYKEFIHNFIKTNFKFLKLGDHSIPLSSENIIFFKTSNNSITVLYNPKGKIGQLLTFKSIMNKYCDSIDNCISLSKDSLENIIEQPSITLEIPQKKLKVPYILRNDRLFGKLNPFLKKDLKDKDKFSIINAQILKFCDGSHNLNEIKELVHIDDFKLVETLFDFLAKKIISFKDYGLNKNSVS